MKKTSIIVPVFNEENTVVELIGKLKSLEMEKEIIIIDDGSTDRTKEILSKIEDAEIKVIFNEKNQGKGSAIISGIKLSSGDMIVIQDADLEYDPNELLLMVDTMIKNDYKVLYGSRFLKKSRPDGMCMANLAANKILTYVANILYNAKITDEATCYKLFQVNILKNLNLKAKKFEFCPEVTAKVRKKGYNINEISISYKARKIKEGKKIGVSDMVSALWTLVKYKFIN